MEITCPACGKAKKKLDRTDCRLNEVFNKYNKESVEELSSLSQEILNMAEYTFVCNCPLNPMYLETKRHENADKKADN